MDKNNFLKTLKRGISKVVPGANVFSALGRINKTPTTPTTPAYTPFNNVSTGTVPQIKNSPLVNRTNSSNTPVSASGTSSGQTSPKTNYINSVVKPMASGMPTQITPSTDSVDTKPVKKQQSAYIEYLKSMFNPDQVKTAQQNVFDLNERIAKENKRARDEEERIRKNEFGQFEGGINAELGELGRVSGRTLSDLTGAKGVATDIYNQMIEAGATVYEAEQAAAEAEAEANKRDSFELGEGQARYEFNPTTGQYELIAERGKTFAPKSGVGGATGGTMSKLAQAVQNGYVSLEQLTPSQRGQVAAELAGSGMPSNVQSVRQSNLDVVNSLLTNPNVGKISGFIQGKLGIGNLDPRAQLALNQYNQLKGILSLENRQQLKGQGAISDFEFKVLSDASTALGRNLSDQEFKTQLQKIKDVFEGKYRNVGGQINQTTPKTLVGPNGEQFDASDLTPQELQEALADGFRQI